MKIYGTNVFKVTICTLVHNVHSFLTLAYLK